MLNLSFLLSISTCKYIGFIFVTFYSFYLIYSKKTIHLFLYHQTQESDIIAQTKLSLATKCTGFGFFFFFNLNNNIRRKSFHLLIWYSVFKN